MVFWMTSSRIQARNRFHSITASAPSWSSTAPLEVAICAASSMISCCENVNVPCTCSTAALQYGHFLDVVNTFWMHSLQNLLWRHGSKIVDACLSMQMTHILSSHCCLCLSRFNIPKT